MRPVAFGIMILGWTSSVLGATFKRQTPSEGYINPTTSGGSMLDKVPDTNNLGEPLNIIISSNSEANVLSNIENYFRSLNFSGECLGQHLGNSQQANLGDGNGDVNQTAVMRYNFGRPDNGGTCTESIQGGNHFRYWVQNGSQANSGAIFLASSYEKSAAENHNIVVDGYNLGRDLIVGNITKSAISNPASGNTFSGSTTAIASDNTTTTYQTDVTYVSGLLSATNDGVNHASDVGVNGKTAIDGLVAVFTVKQTGTGKVDPQPSDNSQSSSNSASARNHPALERFAASLALLATISFSIA